MDGVGDHGSGEEVTGWSTEMSLADQVKAIAEEAVVQSGYAYNEETGLYYDSGTGFYYDPKDGLYYNGYTGTYYRFDEESNSYVFHHQIEGFTFEQAVAEQVHSALNTYTAALSEKIKSEVGTASAEEEEKERRKANLGLSHSLAESLPPCVRLLVLQSPQGSVKIGTLFIVPYTGGCIGRNSDCIVPLEDVNISKNHAKLYYCKENNDYVLQDLGSRNGTWLNSVRLSESKQLSELFILSHDSVLQIGSTELLCHVHPGLETCDKCEPGLLKLETVSTTEVTFKEDLETQRKKEMKKIREKFGLKYHEEQAEPPAKIAGYADRAESRRQTVGVDYVGAKTEVASTKAPIPAKNKGFQLLSKMGWTEGSSLGKTDSPSAITEPISVELRGREGLGSEESTLPAPEMSAADRRKAKAWQKTRERFSQL